MRFTHYKPMTAVPQTKSLVLFYRPPLPFSIRRNTMIYEYSRNEPVRPPHLAPRFLVMQMEAAVDRLRHWVRRLMPAHSLAHFNHTAPEEEVEPS